MTAGSFGSMRSVDDKSQLDTGKFYALKVSKHSGLPELGRFIGMAGNGAAFVIMDNIVRQDSAVENVTVRTDMIPNVVFELEDKGEA